MKVHNWIRKDGDPEPGLGIIERRIIPEGEYKDVA
jgi:hypothetical protein